MLFVPQNSRPRSASLLDLQMAPMPWPNTLVANPSCVLQQQPPSGHLLPRPANNSQPLATYSTLQLAVASHSELQQATASHSRTKLASASQKKPQPSGTSYNSLWPSTSLPQSRILVERHSRHRRKPFLLTLILVHPLTIHDLDLSTSVCTMPLCRSIYLPFSLWICATPFAWLCLSSYVGLSGFLFLCCACLPKDRAFKPVEGSYLVRPFW